MHEWFSGVILAGHMGGPGSIPGPCSQSNAGDWEYKLLEMVRDREAWRAAVHGVTKHQTDWATEQQQLEKLKSHVLTDEYLLRNQTASFVYYKPERRLSRLLRKTLLLKFSNPYSLAVLLQIFTNHRFPSNRPKTLSIHKSDCVSDTFPDNLAVDVKWSIFFFLLIALLFYIAVSLHYWFIISDHSVHVPIVLQKSFQTMIYHLALSDNFILCVHEQMCTQMLLMHILSSVTQRVTLKNPSFFFCLLSIIILLLRRRNSHGALYFS